MLNKLYVKDHVKNAILEDIGYGDITTENLADENNFLEGALNTRSNGVLCGCDVFRTVFETLSDKVEIKFYFKDGDIINVDVSTNLNGYFSDSSRMFCIGNVSEENRKLVEETKNAVYEGLKQVKPWGFLGDMGQAVNDYVKSKGYSVVREVGGHGIGLEFHEDPFVSYVTPKGSEMLLVPGMMFTIEPMINEGSPDYFVDEDNGWTVYTIDDGLSAQIEYMVLVTENGIEVLTK